MAEIAFHIPELSAETFAYRFVFGLLLLGNVQKVFSSDAPIGAGSSNTPSKWLMQLIKDGIQVFPRFVQEG